MERTRLETRPQKVMEDWEVRYRKHLEETLKDGPYQIGGQTPGDLILTTGKGGYIEYLVVLKKSCMKSSIEEYQINLGNNTTI